MSAHRVLLLALGLAGFTPHAWAQVCATERAAHQEAFFAHNNNRQTGSSFADNYLTMACSPGNVGNERKLQSDYRESVRAQTTRRDQSARGSKTYSFINVGIAASLVNICLIQAYLDRCSGAQAPSAGAPAAAPAPSRPSAPAPSRGIRDTMGEAPEGKLATDPALVARRAVDRQVAVEFHRRDKPKRHVPAAEAHKCLTVHKAGGFANSCDFAVEFSFCTYRAKKGSWAEFFDCEKGKTGSWQVSANSRASVHTDAQYVHWFACRYGPKFSQPDGVSPADVEYRPGPPGRLHGRCSQWGAG